MSELTIFNPAQAASLEHHDGWVYKWRFDNDISVSIAQHEYSYGGPEGFFEAMVGGPEQLTSMIPEDLNRDVRGHMTKEQVNELITYLKGLT